MTAYRFLAPCMHAVMTVMYRLLYMAQLSKVLQSVHEFILIDQQLINQQLLQRSFSQSTQLHRTFPMVLERRVWTFLHSASARELEAPPKYNCKAPYNGGLGRSPQLGPGQNPWSGSQRQRPSESETLLVFRRLMEAVNLLTFQKSETQKIIYNFNLCCFCKIMKLNWPQYVTDYCTLLKSNRRVHFG